MRCLILFFTSCLLSVAFAQELTVLKENLSPKKRIYWDAQNKHIQGVGSYFTSSVLPQTTEKHGKWLFYTYDGLLEEEANYYRNRLQGKRTFFYPNKQIKQESYFKFNVPDSIYRAYASDGKVQVRGQFDLGSPTGTWEYFYPDGHPKSIEKVQNDTTYLMAFWQADSTHRQIITNGNGQIITYYISGSLKESFTFQDGLKTGPFEERTANGVVSVAGAFDRGKKDGPWVFYRFDGVLEKRVGYEADSLHGEYLVMSNEKDTLTHGFYLQGLKIKKWKWFTQDGQLDMDGYFQNGKQDSTWHYYFANGQLSYLANYQNDLRTGNWIYYYPNGALYRTGAYLNDQKSGLWQTWYEDSTLLMDGLYVNGKEEGEWINYWENGRIKDKATYRNGALSGKWASYSPEGVLKLEGNYQNGFKVGEWNGYFNNGRIKEKQHYKVFTQKNVADGIAIMGMKETVSDFHGSYAAYSQIDFQLKETGKYYHGMKHGTWTNYYPGGVIPTIDAQYRYGKLDGIFKQYDRYGRIVYEIHYKKGLKDGPFYAFNENGQLVSKKIFKNGTEVGTQRQESFSPY
jgi:antitoxin component YwqK of YwqJK toxin-antitoxin module